MQTPITTIQEIAKALQVTPTTVSLALNGHVSISEATKKPVINTVQKLHYWHNKTASSLKLSRTRIIGVMITSAEINFFGSVVHGIEKVARDKGYSILIFQSNEEMEGEWEGVEIFMRSGVDGVLVSIAKVTTAFEHFIEIKKSRVPLVLFDRASNSLHVTSVVVDDYTGAYKATQHLIAQVCRRIAHIGGQQHVNIFRQRLLGYTHALTEAGMVVSKALIKFGNISVEMGNTCKQELLNLSQPPDGVFAVEDFAALGAKQALKEKNIAIPEVGTIIGFANEAFGAFLTPSLSTLDQQTSKMGEAASQMFFYLLQKTNFYNDLPLKKCWSRCWYIAIPVAGKSLNP